MTKLVIEPKTARLFRDTETFGTMDPYVTIQCGSAKAKTKTHTDGGKTPSWTGALTLKLTGTEDTITFSVWDKDVGDDDLVGTGVLSLATLYAAGYYKDWIELQYKGKPAGELYVEISTTSTTTAYAAPGATVITPGAYIAPAPAPAPAPTPAYYPAATPTYTPTAYPTYAPTAYPGTAYATPTYAPAAYPGTAYAAPAYAPAATPTYTYATAPAPAYPATTYAYAPATYPAGGATYTYTYK